jgi:hypothetical protein
MEWSKYKALRAATLKEAADRAVVMASTFKVAVLNMDTGVWEARRLSPQSIEELRTYIEGRE